MVLGGKGRAMSMSHGALHKDTGITSAAHSFGEPVQSRAHHSPRQERIRLIALAVVICALVSVYPFLAHSSYRGSSDLHAAIEAVGACLALVTGLALITRFYALDNRFHLLIGLAFFVNGAEDLVHGLLDFAASHVMPGEAVASLSHFIPGTYVAGRVLMASCLVAAPFVTSLLGESRRPKRETVWVSLSVLLVCAAATSFAFVLPLPDFIYPSYFVSRPVDLFSAGVFLCALLVFIREYHRTRDALTWWVTLSIGINVAGQSLMSFSKALYDPYFDLAHVYKVLGYAVPLMGFSLYQITVITDRRLALDAARGQAAILTAINTVFRESLRCDTEEDVAKACLAVAEELTASQFGFIGEVNETGRFDTIALTDPGWDACRIGEHEASRMIKDMEVRGIWGNVIKKEHSLIVNAPASHPDSVGVPEGHPPLTSFLGVPLKQGGETVGMIALANRACGYETKDCAAIEALSAAFVEALHRKRAEIELAKHRDHLEELVEDRTAALKTANEDLAARNTELDEFTYIASHDLQEPLRKLTFVAQLLQEDVGQGEPERVNEDLRLISSAAARMRTLIQDLLALSRSGRKDMDWGEVSIGECVDLALDALAVGVAETGAQIVRSDLPVVRGDRGLLTQLYQNLIGNALKFRGEEAPRVVLSCERAGAGWICEVKDNGIGFKPEYAEEIFMPFRRLHSRGKYEGTGIGLAVCRKIVERHGGKIWVESEPGKGAKFRFTIGEKERGKRPENHDAG